MPVGSTVVATMAGGPQIVTFALDELLQWGEIVQELIVVHLAPQADPPTAQALVKLAAEFSGDSYRGHPCRLRFHPLRQGGKKLDDIRDEGAASATWSGIYQLIATLKNQGQRLHVCIAGGRRMLALLATSAAMLHFDHHDCLWHMYTPAEFIAQSAGGAIMHAGPDDGVRLVRVPLVPWGAYFPALRALTSSSISPLEAVAAQTRWLDQAQRARCQQVAERLTPRQLDVLRAFAAGQTPQEVAEFLCITVKTVDSHKTVILDECRAAWGVDEDVRLDYHFLSDKFGPFFAERG